MAQKPHATIPATIKFEDTELSIIDRDGQPWINSTDLASALGYSDTRSVANLFDRNSNEFTTDMSTIIKLMTVGNLKRPTRIFSPRGCHLIAIFARTDKATAFRKWVLDVLEGLQDAPVADKPRLAIAIVATDAKLSKAECKRMAVMAQDGLGRAIVPAHSPMDGDLVFAVATGQRAASDLAALGAAAAMCLSRAIARGVYAARPEDGDLLPCWHR